MQRVRLAWGLVLSCAVAALLARPAGAASGGPDTFGYTWEDAATCSTSIAGFGTGSTVVPLATTLQGPYNLGFTMPYYGQPVSQVWVSPDGYASFGNTGNVPGPNQFPLPGNPQNFIAPQWTATPANGTDITTEAVPGEFRIRWQQHLTASAVTTAYLFLHPDGSFRMTWRGSFVVARSVGYENASGTVGTTLYYDPNTSTTGDEVVAPGYPTPSGSQATCVTAPVLLDCSAPLTVDCGNSVSGTLPATDPSPATVYSCSTTAFAGNEKVVKLTVATPQQVSVSLSNAALSLLQIDSSACTESNCLAAGGTRIDYPILFPGTYTFAVDKPAAGGGDAFTFSSTCTNPFRPIACGDSQAGTTSGAGVFTTYTCTAQSLTGPETLYRLTNPVQQNVVATLTTSVPDLWVVMYDAASFDSGGPCMSAGRGGSGVFDAPPGDYVIVVDGANGASGSYTIDVDCGPQLDCSGSRPASCSTRISGDTTTSPSRVSIYNCSNEALTGGEDVWQFINPVEQTIDARFVTSTPGQRIMLLPACGEGDCLLTGIQGVSCALFPAGSYYLVVDGTSSGPYSIDISCSQISTGTDLRVAAIDASAIAADCSTFDVNGNVRVQVANLGSSTAAGGFDVVVFEDRVPLNARFDPGLDNLLGRTTVTNPLPGGQSIPVDVAATGTLLFRDNVIYAEVDPSNVVPEVDETNNYFDTGRACEYRPPVGVFNPTIEWAWNSSTVDPTFTAVDTVPLIADENGDTVPDIVFTTGDRAGGFGDGVVRCLDGRTGAEIWTASGADCHVHSSDNLALADLSGDTLPEIVGLSNAAGDDGKLVAIDNTGLRFWTSDPLMNHPVRANGGGAPLIADLDCNGRPEVIYGANVFNESGQLVNSPPMSSDPTPVPLGTFGINGAGQDGAIAIAVDIDGDGKLEIVAGPTAYRYDPTQSTLTVIWRNTNVPDGYPAAGNLDDDPLPEIAITAQGTEYVLEGDTGALKWSRRIPSGGGGCTPPPDLAGGPPTIADFDGDCQAEVGVAGADWYTVMETDGTIRWQFPSNDCSSHRTASTVFDFDGDGAAEVAYQDQDWLHVLRGIDGTEITRVQGSSHTWTEMVSIADVDADNNAEIVLPLNPNQHGLTGIEVIGDADDNWVNTRRIWNEHQYHINNINDDSSVPGPFTGSGQCELPSYRLHNTYRDQIGGAIYAAPDITISLTSYVIELVNVGGNCQRQVRISARVGNGGGISVGAPFTAWFWKDDGSGGRQNLVSQVIADLQPGEFYDFDVVVPDPGVGSVDIHAVADDDGSGVGLINECREDNNSCVTTVTNDGLPINPPAPLGPALRVGNHTSPLGATISATLDYTRDQGLPRPPGDHYHVYRSFNNRGQTLARIPSTEGWTSLTYVDTTPATGATYPPSVYYYVVVPADDCEQEAEEGSNN